MRKSEVWERRKTINERGRTRRKEWGGVRKSEQGRCARKKD